MKIPFEVGDLLLDADGKVTKILVIDEASATLHVRLYEGVYADAAAVVAAMTAKTLNGSIGHAPMPAEAFDPKTCATVANEAVGHEELEGYRYYVEEMALREAAPPKPKDEGFFARFWKTFGGNA